MPPRRKFALPLLVAAALINGCRPASVEIDPNGEQRQRRPRQIHAVFRNLTPSPVDLYWAGNVGRSHERSLQLYYGPIEPRGGERSIDAFEGQVFALTEAGGAGRLGEYVLGRGGDVGGAEGEEAHALTAEGAARVRGEFPPRPVESERKREVAKRCRAIGGETKDEEFRTRCERCAATDGCGFSLVRDRKGTGGCFAFHSLATIDTVEECAGLDSTEDARQVPAGTWMNRAEEMQRMRGREPRALRMAYRCLEKAVESSDGALKIARGGNDEATALRAEDTYRRSIAALVELEGKLEAVFDDLDAEELLASSPVFDDLDAEELLASSRSSKLAAVHPNMPMVPRRTLSEGIEYVLRGEPVVITDAFDEGFDTVAHGWTLDYLNREVFDPAAMAVAGSKFNVAADLDYRCCRYFEPQGKSQQAGYPYPFAPTTHLYRDTFGGFVETVRKSNQDAISVEDEGKNSDGPPRLLHYLHEIVMNQNGEVSIAGGTAPPGLVADVKATTDRLRPLASKQPFFGDFAHAKIWLGQSQVVMPMHFDATDNLYVMAWGRKRATIGAPGQLEAMYRYPNGHPLAGSSRVNATEPDLHRFPRFKGAELREVVVGPGDLLYLPAWWWHQFEQPFEDSAALNIWSRDREDAPNAAMRNAAVREHLLADQLEETVAGQVGKEAGVKLDALTEDAFGAGGSSSDTAADREWLGRARTAMLRAADSWRGQVSGLPGGHPLTQRSAAELVDSYLVGTHRGVLREGKESAGESWTPGSKWDLSRIAELPSDLEKRCEVAPESSPFASICG
ncbi:hypothetical protein ACHAWF_017710 [Thalassiosira exigua]